MAALTSAERKRKSREKRRKELGTSAYLHERRIEIQKYRSERVLTQYQKIVHCLKNRERQRTYREKKKLLNKNMATTILCRSVSKAERALPISPRAKIRVVSKLAQKFTPTLVRKLRPRRLDLQMKEDIKEAVEEFFLTPDLSWQASGKKDYKIVQDSKGEKMKVQLTVTLKEAYGLFQELHVDKKISFSKFCCFRPEHVKLRDQTPASVCLCGIHENMRLLIQPIPWLSDSDLITDTLCNNDPSKECFLLECKRCKDSLQDLMNRNGQHDSMSTVLKYSQWSKADGRIKKVQLSATGEEICEIIREKYQAFVKHVYIKRQQQKFFDDTKPNLKDNEIYVQMDFSENFLHFTQYEIQSAYFTNDSSTLFTTMIYYKDGDVLKSVPYVIISVFKGCQGSKGHNKFSVSCFTRKVFEFMQRRLQKPIEKIIFQSDGTVQHLKQKYTLCQVLTLNFPEVNKVEWHFSATSHGKGPIDSLGGTIKRRVTEELKGSRQGITSTENFFDIATKRCPGIKIDYVSHKDVVSFVEQSIADS